MARKSILNRIFTITRLAFFAAGLVLGLLGGRMISEPAAQTVLRQGIGAWVQTLAETEASQFAASGCALVEPDAATDATEVNHIVRCTRTADGAAQTFDAGFDKYGKLLFTALDGNSGGTS